MGGLRGDELAYAGGEGFRDWFGGVRVWVLAREGAGYVARVCA